jgi:multidrug efflux system membrane fusion protein
MIDRPLASELGRLMPRWPARLGAACGLVTALAACGDKAGTADPHASAPPVPVTVTRVVQRDVPVEVRAVGSAEAVSTVQLLPQVGGVVQQVHFHEGDFVKKGDVLFSIDTRPYQATLSVAQAEFERSRALADQAHQEVLRYETLAAEGLTSQLELSQRRANAAALDATLGANRATIQTNSINVQFATIRSPIDGRTGSLLVQAGNLVRPGDGRMLVVIRTLAPIYVRFAVPEQFLASIRGCMKEGPVTVEARPRGAAAVATGELTFIENTVNGATGKIDMKARFANADQVLWPGQFVDVVVRLPSERGVLVVPESAVQTGQEGAYTFVIGPDMKAALRHLEVARTNGGLSVVSKGLLADETVVTDGQVRLRQGAMVQIKAAASAIATGSEGPPGPVVPEPSAQPAGARDTRR